MINIERQCLEQALIIKSNLAHQRLAELRKNRLPLEHPLTGFMTQVEWEKDPKKRMIQLLLMPLEIILIVFVWLLTVPIAYIYNIGSTYIEKNDLKKEIKLYDLNFESTKKPIIKTVESLWELHGLDDEYDMDECIDLLDNWIKILYGAETARNINVSQKVNIISAKRIELNRSYYENPSVGPHFHFVPLLRSVIASISNELGVYATEE